MSGLTSTHTAEAPKSWKGIAQWMGVAIQLLLVFMLIREFRLVSAAFNDLTKLTVVGFVVHSFLPHRYRLPFFLAISLIGITTVLGLPAGLSVIGLGLGLIGICHLALPFWTRVAMLVAAGGALTAFRAGWIHTPLSSAVWPILGSIFMFRLIIYMYDLKHEKEPATISTRLSYFFLLPNVAFPFFPVVDYGTYRRTYYNQEPVKIYRTGITWMFRGVSQLILYRFVYYYLTIAPVEVANAGQLVRFLVSNYLLYLQVSGSFHLVVGTLHLFGFNLPETNRHYLLASGFTDYWRRINIYWKDFMMKVFYYPSYFKLQRLGKTTALILATVVVFIATTLLHTYQWFWLRGGWSLTTQDSVFWTALAVLVIANVVWENRRGRKRTLGSRRPRLVESLGLAMRTVAMFTTICILWSLWTADSLGDWFVMLSAWNEGSALDSTLLVTLAIIALVIGGAAWATDALSRAPKSLRSMVGYGTSPAAVTALILAVLLIGSPFLRNRSDTAFLDIVESLKQQRLSRRDQAQLERGYYENLLGVDRSNAELATLYTKIPDDWLNLWQTNAVSFTSSMLRLEGAPSTQINYKGAPLSMNAWGMRDPEREKIPPPGTFRIALLGASTPMGSGVADEQTFPFLLEEHLNGDTASEQSIKFEVLNFALESYTATEQVYVVEHKAIAFAPSAIFYIAHETEFEKTVDHVAMVLDEGREIPYPGLREILERARVDQRTHRTIARRRLRPFREDIIRWAYQWIVETSQENGILPVWVFTPMPYAGSGNPCQPGQAQVFCFGNLSEAGAAADMSDPRVARLAELATEAGFVILDLSDVYAGHDMASLWLTEWDGHPNRLGHELIAQSLFAAVQDNEVISAASRNRQ